MISVIAVAIVQKHVGDAVRLIGSLARQQFDHRLTRRITSHE